MGSGIVVDGGIQVVEDVEIDQMLGQRAAHICWHR
jgi:hypothetical protein